MINLIIVILTTTTQAFIYYKFVVYFKNIEKEIELQNQINGLATKRLDLISEQLDALYEMVKLESKRLDIYENDNNNDDWWKK
jgi:hypothetical protein